MCLWLSYKKKIWGKVFFASLKSLKKGVGSGFVSQRYGSAPKCHGTPTLLFTLTISVPCTSIKNCLIYSKYLCSEADKQKKMKSPPGVEEERSASKRRRNSSSASTDNPAQGKQKLRAFLDKIDPELFKIASLYY
jgi:hypothetical protein